jgi:hypothetical protein
MTISLEATRNVVWVQVERLHLRENIVIYGYLVETYDDSSIAFLRIVLNHPRMAPDLTNRESIMLVAI